MGVGGASFAYTSGAGIFALKRVDATDVFLAVVADGAGGHPAGDQASRLIVDYLLSQTSRLIDRANVTAVVREANQTLHRHMAGRPDWLGMGSTVAMLAVHDGQGIVANVGDSPIYEIDSQGLIELSTPDNPERPEWMSSNVKISAVTQLLGGHREPREIAPHVTRFPISADTTFLLCSDGAVEALPEQAIMAISTGVAPTARAGALVDAAVQRGTDNATAIFITLDEIDR